MSNIIGVCILDAQARTLQTLDDDGRNVVHRHADEQPITWELVGDAKGGEFTSAPDDPPPIRWIDPQAPAGTFKPPKLSHAKGTLKVNDANDKDSTAGLWRYQLSARIGGVLYQTSLTRPPIVAVSDPVIINR